MKFFIPNPQKDGRKFYHRSPESVLAWLPLISRWYLKLTVHFDTSWVSSSTMRMEFAGLDTTANHHCSYLAHQATTKAFQCFILNFNLLHFIFKVVSSSVSISIHQPLMDGNIWAWFLPSFLSTLFFNASCWCSSIPELLCAESKPFGFLILL